jgi:hypothetical protein
MINSSILKLQQLELENFDLGETDFIGKRRQELLQKNVKISTTSAVDFFQEFRGETSQYEELGKTPISKMQQLFLEEFIFDDLDLVISISANSKTPYG